MAISLGAAFVDVVPSTSNGVPRTTPSTWSSSSAAWVASPRMIVRARVESSIVVNRPNPENSDVAKIPPATVAAAEIPPTIVSDTARTVPEIPEATADPNRDVMPHPSDETAVASPEPWENFGVAPAYSLDDGTPGLFLTITVEHGTRRCYWLDPDAADELASLLTRYALNARLEAALLEEDEDATLGDLLVRLEADDEDEG